MNGRSILLIDVVLHLMAENTERLGIFKFKNRVNPPRREYRPQTGALQSPSLQPAPSRATSPKHFFYHYSWNAPVSSTHAGARLKGIPNQHSLITLWHMALAEKIPLRRNAGQFLPITRPEMRHRDFCCAAFFCPAPRETVQAFVNPRFFISPGF